MLKKSFFDSEAAIVSLKTIPGDDLMRIIGLLVPPSLNEPYFELFKSLNHLDRSMLAVAMGLQFHSGYSTAISDLNAAQPTNLHLEYINEQQSARAAATNPAATAGRPTNNP